MGQEIPTDSLNALPEAYANWRESTLGRITDGLEEDLLMAKIGPVCGRKVLDVGCGDGVLATKVAVLGAEVTGLDATLAMLAAAHERAEKARVSLTLVEGDAGQLPFENGSFDMVVSVATLMLQQESIHAHSGDGALPATRRALGTWRIGKLESMGDAAAHQGLVGFTALARNTLPHIWRIAEGRLRSGVSSPLGHRCDLLSTFRTRGPASSTAGSVDR